MKKLILTILLILISSQIFSQNNDSRLKGLDSEIQTLINKYNAVGISVGIVENNKTIYSKGFGFRDLESKLPVTPNTIFPIASTTKSFTASLLGILENENKVSLNDKPSFYFPKLQFYDDKMDNLITIEDLLSHKTGIGNVDGSYLFFPTNKNEDLIARLKFMKPNGKVKESYLYSNFGYVIAGAIIEKITNESWENNIQKRILTPLNMKNSSTSINEMLKSEDYSFGYGLKNKETQKVLFAESANDKPAGGINSTANDLTNWMMMWLNNGSFQNKQILPANYIKSAMSIKNIENGFPPENDDPNIYTFAYGFGWKVNSYKGHYKVNHGGNASGFSSQLVIFPTDKLGIVVLTNQHNSLLPYIITDLITNRMLNLPKTDLNKYPVIVSDINVLRKDIKGINQEKRPTHKLSDYIGKYTNLGYGTFEIVEEQNNLFAIFKDYKLRLEHQYFDIFTLKATKEISQIMNPEFMMNFSLNNDGNIESVKINLQKEPVEFTKQ